MQGIPAAAYLAALRTAVSRAGIESALNTAAEIICGVRDWRVMDWAKLNAAVVKAIMAKASGAPATRNKLLSALKGTARAAWQLGVMTLEECEKIRSVKGDTGARLPKGRDIRPTEIQKLLEICAADESTAGRRDAAIFSIAAATGARRAELASLTVENMRRENDLTIIRVIGKRDKEPGIVSAQRRPKRAQRLARRARGQGGAALQSNQQGRTYREFQPHHDGHAQDPCEACDISGNRERHASRFSPHCDQ